MHIKENLSEFDFKGKSPMSIDLTLRKNPELVIPFIIYMQNLEMGSEEYNKNKKYWNESRCLKAGYFRALSDFADFWKENKAAIRDYKLSAWDGVDFLIKKLIEKRQGLYYFGNNFDIEFTAEEIAEYIINKNKQTREGEIKWRGYEA